MASTSTLAAAAAATSTSTSTSAVSTSTATATLEKEEDPAGSRAAEPRNGPGPGPTSLPPPPTSSPTSSPSSRPTAEGRKERAAVVVPIRVTSGTGPLPGIPPPAAGTLTTASTGTHSSGAVGRPTPDSDRAESPEALTVLQLLAGIDLAGTVLPPDSLPYLVALHCSYDDEDDDDDDDDEVEVGGGMMEGLGDGNGNGDRDEGEWSSIVRGADGTLRWKATGDGAVTAASAAPAGEAEAREAVLGPVREALGGGR